MSNEADQPDADDVPACCDYRFWRTAPDGPASPLYAECHRRPPRIVDALLPSRSEQDEANGAVFQATWFPATEDHDWCGEHQPATAAISREAGV